MFLKNFKIGQKLFLGFGFVIVLMLGLIGNTYVNFNKQSKAIDLNIESYEVVRKSDQILISIINMETGVRGFALAGKEEFLEPFNKGKAEYVLQFDELKVATRSNPLQQERLEKVQSDFNAWYDYQTSKIIDGRRKVNAGQLKLEDVSQEAQKGIAKQYMDSMRNSLNDINEEEEKLLQVRKDNLERMESMTLVVISVGGIVVAAIAVVIALLVIRMIVAPVETVTNTFKEISEGEANLEVRLSINSKDELGSMAEYFNRFMCKLKELIMENKKQSWMKTGQAELSEKMRGELDVPSLGTNVITYIAKYVNAQIGAIYIRTDEDTFRMFGSYAHKRRKNLSNEIKIGEGIVGQSALEKQSIIITNVPQDYISINTGIGEAVPRNILVTPCISSSEVVCIIELGSFSEFTEAQLQFIEQVSESIAISINSVDAQAKMKELLNKTLEQSEELQAQQEELRQNNEELEEQTKALKESEALMQSQQEELRVTNEELEERTKSLELQKKDIIAKNESLNKAQLEILQKAKAIESANNYKSEFLANMSHELRTPLNSIIVLSQMLSENKDSSTLTKKQLQFARTIHSSGEDLLKLINDILDLSKVEAGKLDINLEKVNLRELVQYVEHTFNPIAENKGLSFNIQIEEDVPVNIVSDSQRVHQILNNLLSNAFKFTQQGGVTLSIGCVKGEGALDDSEKNESLVAISVEDTGIGVSIDKQEVIFEAFKQSDGTTSRKYGGTGLGLSISKELARLLGGTIKLVSEVGRGSKFTLFLPINSKDVESELENKTLDSQDSRETSRGLQNEANIKTKDIITKAKQSDDREEINSSDKILLIIEDDRNFASILSELAHEKGYKCVVAEDGHSGIKFAEQYKPDAIFLDIGLPDISGWKVVEKLKEYSATEDIPVHIISGRDESESIEKADAIIGYLEKPVSLKKIDDVFKKIESTISKQFKKLLIADDTEDISISSILGKKGIKVETSKRGIGVLNLLKREQFDCMILGYNLLDMTALELLEKLKEENLLSLPIIIYTDKELTQEDDTQLQKYAESIIIKGTSSTDRLIAEASLFLHDVDSKIEKNKINVIKSSIEKEDIFKNKKVLIVDDDMRNVFALTSVLEEKGLKVIIGRNGKEGIDKLNENVDVDLILMDIMMPEMDGYTAIREIRKDFRFSKIPIIAATAKAMKEDRQKCIEAGADDYLTKPIDIERLMSLFRVWLYK